MATIGAAGIHFSVDGTPGRLSSDLISQEDLEWVSTLESGVHQCVVLKIKVKGRILKADPERS